MVNYYLLLHLLGLPFNTFSSTFTVSKTQQHNGTHTYSLINYPGTRFKLTLPDF